MERDLNAYNGVQRHGLVSYPYDCVGPQEHWVMSCSLPANPVVKFAKSTLAQRLPANAGFLSARNKGHPLNEDRESISFPDVAVFVGWSCSSSMVDKW